MQPRNPYQGQPTSNMSFPTEAYMAAAANAAKIQADAQARMGEQIGKGLQSAASSISGAMTEKAAEKADYDASLKLYDSPSFQKAMGLTAEDANKEKKILKDLVGEGGYKAANSYAKQGISPLFKYAQMGKEFEMQKELQRLRNEPAYARGIAELAGSRGGGGGVVMPSVEEPVDFTQFGGLPPARRQQNYGGAWTGVPYK